MTINRREWLFPNFTHIGIFNYFVHNFANLSILFFGNVFLVFFLWVFKVLEIFLMNRFAVLDPTVVSECSVIAIKWRCWAYLNYVQSKFYYKKNPVSTLELAWIIAYISLQIIQDVYNNMQIWILKIPTFPKWLKDIRIPLKCECRKLRPDKPGWIKFLNCSNRSYLCKFLKNKRSVHICFNLNKVCK